MSSNSGYKNCGTLLLLALGVWVAGAQAQPPNLIRQAVDSSRTQQLAHHHPQWANASNSLGAAPAEQRVDHLTLALARTAEQEQALQQLLADQQRPGSANYHRWLTAAEFGERFGASDADLAAITGWLQDSGLHVNGISASRSFVEFGGSAGAINQAFQTELRRYRVNGEERLSVANEPSIPAALAPAILAIRGLATQKEYAAHGLTVRQAKAAPQLADSVGDHYITPADFRTIYDVPSSGGAGVTIGIVGRSRTDFADYANFRARTGVSFADPTEQVIGTDPGAALTEPPTDGSSVEDQREATMDVERAGSVAPGATLLLAVADEASGGVYAAAQYLIQNNAAQVVNISYAACELMAGQSGTDTWNALFQQAAAEGISVFVASGDAGASGCDTAFTTPPASPAANSPNALCSSKYVTCVGGTEFADYTPSDYWDAAGAAKSYIPEGAWNEPTDEDDNIQVAASGGGVSAFIATPDWQAGLGVPTARKGRYTPDVSFSASAYDGYFGCFAADGGDCTVSNGSFSFVAFYGTSASAPSMAGVAALLDATKGGSQGNLNPGFYSLAARQWEAKQWNDSFPEIFHDVTLSSSGVDSECDVNTPSMCNNSIPSSSSLSGGQAGYVIGDGYDEATGLGSLDVQAFLDNYSLANYPQTALTPTVTVTPASNPVAESSTLPVAIQVSGGSGNPVPTGYVVLSSSSYLSANTYLLDASGGASITVPAYALPAGIATLTALYTPDANSASIYTLAQGAHTVTVLPAFTITGPNTAIAAGATTGNTVAVTVTPAKDFTGDVRLTAAITSMPANAQYLPTLSFNGGDTVTISSSSAASTQLTITTTLLTASAPVPHNGGGDAPWRAAGGGVLACLIGFGLRGRRGLRLYWSVILLAAAVITTACNQLHVPSYKGGTTPGAYVITVTGTSGSLTKTGTIQLTVR